MLYLVGVILILVKISLTRGLARELNYQSLVHLNVERELICANRGDLLTLNCTLATRNKNIKNWTLSWNSEGIPLIGNVTETWKNTSHLTSHLRLYADWVGEKLFTCMAYQHTSNAGEYVTLLNSTSVVKVKAPINCDIIGFRLMEKPMFLHSLEVYWRPVRPAVNVMYKLNFCTESEEHLDEDMTHVCPHYHTVNSACYYRDRDVYNLPDTKGSICSANISTFSGLSMYVSNRVHISSRVAGESCEHRCSNERRLYPTHSRDFLPEPGKTEVVVTPMRVARLSILARVPREVTLVWSDPSLVSYAETRTYRVHYKCSNDSSWNKTAWLIQTKLTFNSKSFQNYQPYDLCRFCVIARAFEMNGASSEPLCEDTRLHEEPPSGAPTIMCPKNECQTMRNEHERNVSITWTLPPRRYWNGVLTGLRIFYRSEHEKNLEYFSDYSNRIDVHVGHNITTGRTLLTRLSVNQTYWVHMVACNKEGCSRPGTAIKILSLPQMVSHRESALRLSTPLVVLASISTIFLTIFLIYLTYACVKTRGKLRPKLELKICEPPGYDVIMENAEKGEYDVIIVLDTVRYVGITRSDVYTTQKSSV